MQKTSYKISKNTEYYAINKYLFITPTRNWVIIDNTEVRLIRLTIIISGYANSWMAHPIDIETDCDATRCIQSVFQNVFQSKHPPTF